MILTNFLLLHVIFFYYLNNILNSDYDKNYYLCPFNKLNRRGKWNIYNGKNITNYGYIIYNYKFSY